MNVVQEWRAVFASAPVSVGEARRAVSLFARSWFSGQALADIESAVGEALANCVEHGHQTGGEIDVRCSFDNRTLVIDIKDAGRGFERPERLASPPPASSLRGYGMFIMQQLMDGIEYSEHGTRIRLVKQLLPVPADRKSTTT